MLDMALIVMCGLSFSIVENVFFISFLNMLRPGYSIPSRDFVARTLLPKLYGKVCLAMKKFFTNSKALFTVHLDGWTDNSKNAIVGVSATEGIDRFELSLSLLSRAVGAAGENANMVLKLFESVTERIGLRKVVAICTDNASVMSKARSLFVSKFPRVSVRSSFIIVIFM
jgi:hypothetical protein